MRVRAPTAFVYRLKSLPYQTWLRNVVSVGVLGASVLALGLIMHQRYGEAVFNTRTYTRILTGERSAAPDVTDATNETISADSRRQRALAEFLARKYKVSQDATLNLVDIAHSAGHQLGLDPLLIIAVMAVESRLNPIAESVAGAKGLMQVIPKYHTDKLQEYGGIQAVFDPEANIRVGSQILRDYLRMTGSLGSALQMYAGALNDDDDVYTTKVLSEKQRLQQVVSQSISRVQRTKAAARTTGADGVPL
jgi:soluble lytic murein transglycosylase-like protein